MTTKILYTAVPRGADRVPVVSAEEWQSIFSEYPDSIRYRAANMAAHNWDVVLIRGRLLIASPWSFSACQWWDKDGNREPLSREDFDKLYTEAPAKTTRFDAAYTYDGDTKTYRSRTIALAAQGDDAQEER